MGEAGKISTLQVEKTGEYIDGRPVWEVLIPLVYQIPINGGQKLTLVVPAGFKSDLASTPRAVWWLVPPDGKWTEPAVVHDYLYSQRKCSRWVADALFRQALRDVGVGWWLRWLIWLAVRLFAKAHKA